MPRKKTTKRTRIIRRSGDNDPAQLLRLAGIYFRQHGYEGTSMRALADALGVNTGTIYYYFENKESLFLSHVESELVDFKSQIDLVMNLEEPADTKLAEFVACHIDFQTRDIKEGYSGCLKQYNLGDLVRNLDTASIRSIKRIEKQIVECLKTVLTQGQKEDVFNFPDITLTAFSILALGEQLVFWFKAEGALSISDVKEQLQLLALRIAGATSPTDKKS